MRAAVLSADRTLLLTEVAEPTPGPGEVRVRVAACGLCGSDLHLRRSAAIPPGTVLGHEVSGVVDEVGAGVSGWRSGERVAVYPFAPLDHHDFAAALTGVGCGGPPGGLAESLVVPADRLWRLPAELDLVAGALVEPIAVALHGLDVAGARPEDRVAVVGAGPIGVLVALACRARGGESVVVVEPNPARRARVAALGIPAVELDGVHDAVATALGGPPRVVLECAGHPSAPPLALELVAPSGGVVALLGMHEEPVPVSQLLLMLKEAQLRASFTYRPACFDEAVNLLATGRIDPTALVTARHPLADAQSVLDRLEDPATDELKVLLIP